MKYFSKLGYIAVVALALFAGCKGKDGDLGPAGASGSLIGDIVGYVSPVDEDGSPIAKNGITVSIDGATPAITATTDATGKFTLAGVRNGTYNFTYSGAGIGTLRRFGIGHVGGSQPTYLGSAYMAQVSTKTVSSLTAYSSTYPISAVSLSASIRSTVPVTSFYYAVLCSSPIDNDKKVLYIGNAYRGIAGNTSSITAAINKATFNDAGFASGSTVYLAVTGISLGWASTYFDPATGQTVCPTLNPVTSNVVTVVVP